MPEPDLLTRAVEAHGGAALWESVETLHYRLRVRRNILMLRGRSPRTRAMTVSLSAHRIEARLDPYPAPGHVGMFEGDAVHIEDEAGRVVARRAVAPGARLRRRWDALDELYFLGYAFWNYATTPFLLARPDVTTRELAPAHGLPIPADQAAPFYDMMNEVVGRVAHAGRGGVL